MSPLVVVVSPMPNCVAERAAKDFRATLSQERDMTSAEFIDTLHATRAPAALLTVRVKLDAAAIASLPSDVRVIATASAGVDHIDLAAAQARGLLVTNTPDALTEATAELTLMLLLCACRRAREYTQIMQAGWRQRFQFNQLLGLQLSGKTLGIVGMGRIGRAVAQRAQAFGMRVIYHNRRRLTPELEAGATYFSELRELLPHCQLLTLHVPGTSGTPILDDAAIALLPQGAVIVNTGRGQLIDEEALIRALTSGTLAAAGLDVFRSEPDYDLRLRELPNVFLTPHMGSATIEARTAMGMRALDNLAAVLSGNPPLDPVRL